MSVWDDLVGQESAVKSLQTAAYSAFLAAAHADSDSATGGTEQVNLRGPNAPTATDGGAVAATGAPDAMTHSWLVVGPPGSGRSLAGRAFAAALQCENGTGCGACKGCRLTLKGSHPDVKLVRTDRVLIAIDEVTELVSLAAQTPSQGHWRVIVVEDADRMQERTTNLLLKSIEEPAPHTVWVLCAPSPHDLLPTIRSRCRLVQLRVPPAEAVAELLQRRYQVDAELALQCAQQAQSHIGSARHLATVPLVRETRELVLRIPTEVRSAGTAAKAAEKLLAQTNKLFKAEQENLAEVELDKLVKDLGYEREQDVPTKLKSQLKALRDDQKRRATRAERDVIDRALIDLMGFYRDVYLAQLGVTEVAQINGDMAANIQQIAQQTEPAVTVARIDAIQATRRRLAANVPALLAVEAMMMTFRPQYHPAHA